MALSKNKRLSTVQQKKTYAMLAHRVYGAGYNSGAAPLTGDGTAKTYSNTFVNDSGAPITVFSLVFQGWTLTSAGTTDTGNDYVVTGNVEYPVGGTTTDVGSIVVTSGAAVAGPPTRPAVTIPAGASFKVNLSSTVGNGLKYIVNLGFAGLRNHAPAGTMKRLCVAGFGDSIMTNNGGALYNAALSRCPAYLSSIIGTTAAAYGASGAANFVKQVAISQLLGATHVMSNFGTNDFGASTPLSTLQGYLASMRDVARSRGMKFVQTTMTPRTATTGTLTATTVTSSGTSMTVALSDVSKFTVNQMYTTAGATQTEYNGNFVCTAVDSGAGTVTLLFPGSATTPATGTITVTAWKSHAAQVLWMQPTNSFYASGGASPRGLFNAWVRGGAFDSYIDWADAVEPSRDSGRWLVAGESSLLNVAQLITVASVVNTSRFTSNYTAGTSTIPNGAVQPVTGANAGVFKGGNGNTNGDITVTSAWTNAQVIGDQYWAFPGTSYMSDDGLHPRVAGGGKGGQPHLDNATSAWITANL
jgi:hypothetical protein